MTAQTETSLPSGEVALANLPRVDMVTPLSPSRSGIANYVEELLPAHALHWNCRVIVKDEVQAKDKAPGMIVVPMAQYSHDAETPVLVHIGNNIHHEFAFKFAEAHPSIIVLHDFNLHHLITEITLAREDEAAYSRYLQAEYGDLGRRVADQRRQYAFSYLQEFLMPINRPLLIKSRGVVVHSRWAQQELVRKLPTLPIAVIPHHFTPEARSSLSKEEAKVSFGIEPQDVVIGALGFVTPPKQVDLLLKAAAQLDAGLPSWRILIAGEAADEAALRRLIGSLGLSERVVQTGYVATNRFNDAVEACDIVSSLRYPTAGETSGVLIKAMGAGRCCLVFRYGSFTDFPSNAVLPVPLDTRSPLDLAAVLHSAISSESLRRKTGERAREFTLSVSDPRRCAQMYNDFVKKVYTDYNKGKSNE